MPIGRVTQVVDCRESMGMGKGGGLAQRGTISECRHPDVIVVGMSPGRRHVTKPVCDITSALRREGVEFSVSTLVLNAGSGVPPDSPKIAGSVLGAYFGLTEKEIEQIEEHKVAILHHGNVRSHVVQKVRFMLEHVDVKAVVVSQAPIDYEDLAKEGVKTAFVMPSPDKVRTRGRVEAIVSGVTRGQTPTREKMAEVIAAVTRLMKEEKY
ncbi:MAG: methyl-coenzyme M reductase I operon protein C [Methanofollis liminatans]|uniref:Methyl-coenzyme M reductase operon protein C n=3 Tax=Methanofollis TaxID=81416 RepID=A0A7K4HN01_9EURY|nr:MULTISPECIES: methyl-coenzyme M reductase I operon protein C [Methanofollis]EJG06468.1 methyl-coenzyme M reductase I operon protein C [Methanofollis liminatans DSM 4140]MDD3110915.1 methyl-coenzyme M reductase I operon protein C [Methanofollis liminatans]NVO66589.1 methyl-coenzyme M reductase I operon protein C [Methanofollis tationis]HDS63678.1 methyl-coenzyme M reductase I operon protein C [Methanofollis liminatans]